MDIAGERILGTTHKKPLSVFEEEELLPLPTKRCEEIVWKKARVHQDSHVQFDKKLYSVPWRFVGKELWLRALAGAGVSK